MTAQRFTEGAVPPESSLNRSDVKSAWFSDSYQAEMHTPSMSVTDVFEAVLGHHPRWMRTLLTIRNRIAGRAGLVVPPDELIDRFERKPHYAVGDLIGPWPIYHLSDTELIAGRDNSHLDFRLSVLKLDAPLPSVAISTICNVHNRFEQFYLFFIVPFHRLGMRLLMRRAIAAGRL
jgi:Protein of unknown function (DUF2867)